MKIRKTWYGYVTLAFFAGLLAVSLSVSAVGISGRMNVRNTYIAIIVTYTVVLVCTVLIFLMRKGLYSLLDIENKKNNIKTITVFPSIEGEKNVEKEALKKEEKEAQEKEIKRLERIRLIEVLVFVFIVVTALCIRMGYMVYRNGSLSGDSSFFHMASIQNSGAVSYLSHGASNIYTQLLSGLFMLFGNRASAAICLQILFQLCTIMVLFYVARALFGKAAGYVAMLAATVMPHFVASVTEMNPDNFMTFLYSCSFGVLVFIMEQMKSSKKKNKINTYVMTTCLGVLCGILCYLDITGIGFLASCFIALLVVDKSKKNLGPIKYLLLLAGCIASILVVFFLKALVDNMTVLNAFQDYFRIYIEDAVMNHQIITPGYGNISPIFVLMLSSLWIVGFWNMEKVNVIPVVWFTLAVVAVYALGYSQISYDSLMTVMWCLLAGNGVGCLACYKKKAEKKRAEDAESQEEKRIEWRRNLRTVNNIEEDTLEATLSDDLKKLVEARSGEVKNFREKTDDLIKNKETVKVEDKGVEKQLEENEREAPLSFTIEDTGEPAVIAKTGEADIIQKGNKNIEENASSAKKEEAASIRIEEEITQKKEEAGPFRTEDRITEKAKDIVSYKEEGVIADKKEDVIADKKEDVLTDKKNTVQGGHKAEGVTLEKKQETASDRKESETQKTKTAMIENPLPLPKKHEHKEMDYEYTVSEAMMKFDIEISDTDDFDLR